MGAALSNAGSADVVVALTKAMIEAKPKDARIINLLSGKHDYAARQKAISQNHFTVRAAWPADSRVVWQRPALFALRLRLHMGRIARGIACHLR